MIVRAQVYSGAILIIHEIDHGNRRGARIFPMAWLQQLKGFLSAKRLQSPVVARFIRVGNDPGKQPCQQRSLV
jgi:hypothetical protein